MKKIILSLIVSGLLAIGAKAQLLGSTYTQITDYLEGRKGTNLGFSEGNNLYYWLFDDGGELTGGFRGGLLIGLLFKSPYAYSEEEIDTIILNSTRRASTNFAITKETEEGASFLSADGVFIVFIDKKHESVYVGYYNEGPSRPNPHGLSEK